jgi:hypothetical protein
MESSRKQFALNEVRGMIDSRFDFNDLNSEEKNFLLKDVIEDDMGLELLEFLLNMIMVWVLKPIHY